MSKILVIEDEVAIRVNILKILQHHEFEVIGAANGAIGVELAQQHLPDLIVCDILMPELDGYGVLAAVRSEETTTAIPFVFLTARSERSDMRQGMNLGADDYLTKPFTHDELLEAVTARLRKQTAIAHSYLRGNPHTAAELDRLTHRDPLTDLPNRAFLTHRIQAAIAQQTPFIQAYGQLRSPLIAVLCINLSRFSIVNSNFGTQVGDCLLQAIAERLQRQVTQADTIARVGADEFCVVSLAINRGAVLALAQMIVQVLNGLYHIADQSIMVQVNVGIAIYPNHGDTADRLWTKADLARRWGRQQGHSYHVYDPAWDAADEERRSLETEFQLALERSELLLHYQPQVDSRTGEITGVEALVRWNHARKGLISPSKFIPIAEETGLVVPLGNWVLERACQELQPLFSRVPLCLSVNLSAQNFRQPNLVWTVAEILERTQFNPAQLVIEITETSVLQDMAGAIATVKQLKALGIHVAIDDFGMGYSSLNYLRELPIDELKIDRAFITNVNDNLNDAEITQAIIGMAKNLRLKVIAEGVENEAQIEFLRHQGCYLIQGHFYSPALRVDELQQVLNRK
jgi:diguanylate cyclase